MLFVKECQEQTYKGQTNHQIVQMLSCRIMSDDAEIAKFKASGDNPDYLILLEGRKPLLEGAKTHFERLVWKEAGFPSLCGLLWSERRA